MSGSNQHIEEYLKQYLDLPQPGFAVLIKGGWGSGKTYFVDLFIKRHCPVSGKDDLTDAKKPLPLMISLFGVRSRADIDERIYEATHAFTSKPMTQLGFSLLKGAAQVGFLVKGNEKAANALDTGSKLLAQVWKRVTNNSNIILVFDDVERADMDLRELLGTINPFVESQKMHCILIAEEDVWDKVNQVEENDHSKLGRLSAVKEKVIGKTFHLQTDPLEVFQQWLEKDSLLGDRARLCLSGRVETLHKIFACAPKQNFRAMRHTLLDFQRFIGSEQAPVLEKRHFEHVTFMNLFIEDFVMIQYWAHLGEIKSENVGKSRIDEIRMVTGENKGRSNELSKWDRLTTSLDVTAGILPVVSNSNRKEWENLWTAWLEKNWVDPKSVKDLINSSIWFDGHEKYWSQMYFKWHELNDQDGVKAKKALEVAIATQKITNPSMILRYFDSMLSYAYEGALEKGPEQVLKEYISYVDGLRDLLEPLDVNEHSGVTDLNCKDKPQEIAFKKHLESAVEQVRDKAKMNWADDFLKLLKEDHVAAMNLINYIKNGEPHAILSKVSPIEFVKIFCGLDYQITSDIMRALTIRYELVYQNQWLLEELPFIENLRQESERKYKESPKPLPPSVFRLKYLNQSLDKALEHLRKMNDNSTNEKPF